jgi:hypothetical protein
MAILKSEMVKLEAKLAQKSQRHPTNYRAADWTSIRTDIEKAADDFKNKPTGGKTIECFRMLSNNATVLQDWLAILPTGDYGSIISGVFGLVTKVSLLPFL